MVAAISVWIKTIGASYKKPTIMAELQQTETRKQKGVRRSKKLSTKVDLTPMVDLGFLLITFFVFTTSITKPTVMNIIVPEDGPPIETSSSKTLSVILAANNIVYYYQGDSLNNLQKTNFSAQGLRKIIMDKKREVLKKFGDGKETVVLIKPTNDASYNNIVDALDEIKINEIERYVLMDADENETSLLFKHQ